MGQYPDAKTTKTIAVSIGPNNPFRRKRVCTASAGADHATGDDATSTHFHGSQNTSRQTKNLYDRKDCYSSHAQHGKRKIQLRAGHEPGPRTSEASGGSGPDHPGARISRCVY